jgi:hypothetical protein
MLVSGHQFRNKKFRRHGKEKQRTFVKNANKETAG